MHAFEPGLDQSPETGTVFLSTKLAPPQGGKSWVSRARLTQRLGVPPQMRLCLVHAGAGFGKTACLAQWYRALSLTGIKVAWLSLDRDDDNLPLFIAYIAAAINRVCPEIGTDVIDLAARHGKLARPDGLRTTLLNAVDAWSEPLVLIVDDYHLVETPEVNAWIAELIVRAPGNFHLVLASRSVPDLRLARLRASGEVSEITAADLALSIAEVRDFIQVAGDGEVLGQDIAAAHAQTEGWAVGLQMIALAMRNRRGAGKTLGKTLSAFSGEARAVSDYLRDEVLAYLPSDLGDFLVRISILERFCPELCVAVSGRSDAGELLAQAVARELFVLPLDDKAYWHRYHQLFADFLHSQLKALQDKELKEMHARACTWFADRSLWTEAVRHAIASGAETRALEIAERCAMELVRDGDFLALQALITKLPADQQRHGPLLRLAEAWVLAVNGQSAEVEMILDDVAASTARVAMDQQSCAAEMLAIRAALAYVLDDSEGIERCLARWDGRMQSANAWVDDVMKAIASANLIWCGRFASAREFLPCVTTFKRVLQLTLFGWSWQCEGRVAEAEREWLEAVDLADSELGARSTAALIPRVPLARLAYERGDFDVVEMLLATRMGVLEQVTTTDFLNQAVYALGWSRYASGDRGSAIELHERLRLMAMERGMMRLEAHTSIELMRICWLTQPDRVAHLAQRLHAIVLAQPGGHERSTRWLGTRLAAVGVSFHRALNTVASHGLSGLDAVVQDIVGVARGPHTVNVWLLLLIAAHQAGDQATTRKALTAAVVDGQGYGIARSFVDTGDWLLPLLHDLKATGAADRAGIDPAYLAGLIAGFTPVAVKGRSRNDVGVPKASPLVDSLSSRELDILSLVERGLSNKLICRTLNIGPETVKWHLKNLFSKLGVSNRLQAVNQARALSLLPPPG